MFIFSLQLWDHLVFPSFLNNTRSTIVIDQVKEDDVVNFLKVIKGMIQKYKVTLKRNRIISTIYIFYFFAMKCNQKVKTQSSHDNEILYEVLGVLEPIVGYGYCWNVQEYQLHDLVNILKDENNSN